MGPLRCWGEDHLSLGDIGDISWRALPAWPGGPTSLGSGAEEMKTPGGYGVCQEGTQGHLR